MQNPAIVSDRSVPQPDLTLLEPRADSYSAAHPTAADILLAIEVADTTLAFDLGTKVPLYAIAGVREVWVVDVNEQAIRVFRDPSAAGYKTSFTVAGEDSVTSLALPDCTRHGIGSVPDTTLIEDQPATPRHFSAERRLPVANRPFPSRDKTGMCQRA